MQHEAQSKSNLNKLNQNDASGAGPGGELKDRAVEGRKTNAFALHLLISNEEAYLLEEFGVLEELSPVEYFE